MCSSLFLNVGLSRSVSKSTFKTPPDIFRFRQARESSVPSCSYHNSITLLRLLVFFSAWGKTMLSTRPRSSLFECSNISRSSRWSRRNKRQPHGCIWTHNYTALTAGGTWRRYGWIWDLFSSFGYVSGFLFDVLFLIVAQGGLRIRYERVEG